MTPIYDQLLHERHQLARHQNQEERMKFLEDMDQVTRPYLVWP